MWTYEQATGVLRNHLGMRCGTGYSGAPGHVNVPMDQTLKNLGPIPRGRYTVAAPVDTKTHGPYVLWLTPDPMNAMYGRSAFGIHGDSVVHPGTASEGCIILPRAVREQLWASGDHELQVVADGPVVKGD